MKVEHSAKELWKDTEGKWNHRSSTLRQRAKRLERVCNTTEYPQPEYMGSDSRTRVPGSPFFHLEEPRRSFATTDPHHFIPNEGFVSITTNTRHDSAPVPLLALCKGQVHALVSGDPLELRPDGSDPSPADHTEERWPLNSTNVCDVNVSECDANVSDFYSVLFSLLLLLFSTLACVM